MRLIKLTVENFRCYADETSMQIDDLTALIGQNDVGKSAMMDALAIFFESASPDKDDACKFGDLEKMRITCEFDQLPEQLIVDTDCPTTLESEHLLSRNGTLVVRKTYNGKLISPRVTAIEAIANHPTLTGFNDLLTLKKLGLAARATELDVNLDGVDKRKNAYVRAAIWAKAEDLQLESMAVPLEQEGAKQVWSALLPYLPIFALFKSDRSSTDQDSEAQDPLKTAIREAIKDVETELLKIKEHVEKEVEKIADATVEKLREMDPSVAQTLNPVITTKKWESLFHTSITGDEGIPLNKRGSGVKRLVLLNFFRAKAEKDARNRNTSSIIYAIEEPETSQHPHNQRLLLSALRELAIDPDRQVILTTHTPMLARYLPSDSLRFLQKDNAGNRIMMVEGEERITEISKSLGVLPDHNVRVFIGVEGVHDINFLKRISIMLIDAGEKCPDLDALERNGELIFFPFGGNNLALWTSRLKSLNRPEYHIYDRDNPPPGNPRYENEMDNVNKRKNCTAVTTNKREMENYLHKDAIVEAYAENDIDITLPDFADFDNVPSIVAEKVYTTSISKCWNDLSDSTKKKKISNVKRQLNGLAVEKMNIHRLERSDPKHEIRGWLADIAQIINGK